MLVDGALPVPASLMAPLASFASLFSTPSFRTFCGLACGFLAQTGKRTVCGMLAGAGLARAWPHDRAHRFFSRARWNPEELGLAVAQLVVALLVPASEPVTVAIDDTLFKRRGKKVWAASWFHDGSAPGPAKTGYGNNWVVAAIVVWLPAVGRPVAIPVLAKLPPERTGRRGRPKEKGDRLPSLAATAAFTPVTVTRYGKAAVIQAAAVTCLWHSVFGARPVTVVLIRDRAGNGYDLALVTTGTAASAAATIERYAARWSIEVAIEDSKQIFGTGQARNRTARAVERAVPFQLACQAIATT
jgi:SRSO17 transposase